MDFGGDSKNVWVRSSFEKRTVPFEMEIRDRKSFRNRAILFVHLFRARFEGNPEIFAAEGSFESIAEFDFDDFFGFLTAPNASAGSEVFDCDEHGRFLV